MAMIHMGNRVGWRRPRQFRRKAARDAGLIPMATRDCIMAQAGSGGGRSARVAPISATGGSGLLFLKSAAYIMENGRESDASGSGLHGE